jgi:glycosyltransferase involved in cell wall biosynthesis
MRIGIFSECYNPVLNGVVVSINTFKTELEKRGHEFYIFTTASLDRQASDSHIIRFPIMLPFKSKGGKYPIAWPQNAKKVSKKIAELKIDLVHSQHMLGLGQTGRKAATILGIPRILTYHTLLAEYAHYVPLFSGLARRYLISQSKKICNCYDQIVTPSPSMAKVLKSYGVTQSIESIATGVDLANYENSFSREELNQKWHVPTDKKLLLYLSRVAKEKNLDFLLESIKILKQKRTDFHLLVVGGGPELLSYQKSTKKWGLSSVVTFTDMQPKKEANRFFGAADIFVFPSITETQGIVITEAMAAGTPAVAINIMGPSDIIENGIDGYLTDLNVDEFTDKINSLLDNENLRKKLGAQAKQNAQKYSTQVCADKLENLYEKVTSHYRAQSNPQN